MARTPARRAARPVLRPGCLRDLQITGAGHLPRKREWIHQAFNLFGIALVVAGRGAYRVDDGPAQRVEPGSALPVYPGPTFHYGPEPGQAWEEHFVTFVGRGARRWRKLGWMWTDASVRVLSSWTAPVQLHHELLRVMQRGEAGDADRAVVITERYLLELFYGRRSLQQQREPDDAMQAVLEHCRRHYAEAVDFETLAQQHALSYSSLRQKLRRVTGVPPARYLAHLRCDEACRLLAESDLSVKEIAARVGVGDAYTFSRTFRRCVGVSPAQYRAAR